QVLQRPAPEARPHPEASQNEEGGCQAVADTIDLVAPGSGPAAAHAPHSPLSADLPRCAGRYLVEEEIGRGGMGAVLRVPDPDLQRPLAVKLLLRHAAGKTGAIDRFLEEARLTGQLQHPGIPPIHELGRLDDGRPFFAMKLIRGQTLAALLMERQA